MITILKETPITAFGRDCMEQLVQDDALSNCCPCDKCYYFGYDGYSETLASCMEVHGCTPRADVYFRIVELCQ